MVLIKRVMIAAAMSLLSEGAIAGVMPEAPAGKTPVPHAHAESAPASADVATPETR